MKKVSILAASLLCVTIGGVYATWTYATKNVTDAEGNVSVGLTGVVDSDGTYGSYSVAINVELGIDPKADGTDYEAVLNFYEYAEGESFGAPIASDAYATTAAVVITYTPAASGIPDDVKAYGVETTWQLVSPTAKEDWKYGESTIFSKIDTATKTIAVSGDSTDWTRNSDGSFTYIITVQTLSNMITLSTGIKLDTYDKYTAFDTALGTTPFTITVTDGIAD